MEMLNRRGLSTDPWGIIVQLQLISNVSNFSTFQSLFVIFSFFLSIYSQNVRTFILFNFYSIPIIMVLTSTKYSKEIRETSFYHITRIIMWADDYWDY